MAGNSTKAMLQTYLKEDVDESLLHYVATNAHEVLYSSQEQICAHAGINENQLLAFFRAFNVDKLIAFKFILRKCLYKEVTDLGVAKRSLSSMGEELIRQDIFNLSNFAVSLDYDKVEQLAEDILASPEVVIFSPGTYAPIGQAFSRMLSLWKIPSRLYDKYNTEEQNNLDVLSPSALVLGVYRRRYSMQHLMQIRLLKQRGFHIVTITDSEDSPFIPVSDYHFTIPSDAFDFADSCSCGLAFINILSISLGLMNENNFYTQLHKRDVQTQENNMFW